MQKHVIFFSHALKTKKKTHTLKKILYKRILLVSNTSKRQCLRLSSMRTCKKISTFNMYGACAHSTKRYLLFLEYKGYTVGNKRHFVVKLLSLRYSTGELSTISELFFFNLFVKKLISRFTIQILFLLS